MCRTRSRDVKDVKNMSAFSPAGCQHHISGYQHDASVTLTSGSDLLAMPPFITGRTCGHPRIHDPACSGRSAALAETVVAVPSAPGTGLLRTLAGHAASVFAVAVTPDGRRAVSASVDKTLKVWDLESGGELRTLAGHAHFVTAVAVMPDGRRAVSASYDKTLKVWDLDADSGPCESAFRWDVNRDSGTMRIAVPF